MMPIPPAMKTWCRPDSPSWRTNPPSGVSQLNAYPIGACRSVSLNPLPRILDVELGPYNGRARVATRIRLAVSQQVRAVAVMSDGTLWSAAADVEVTVGGCDP